MFDHASYIRNANRKRPDGDAGPKPRPNQPSWITVRCADCGKVLCEVRVGSTVKIRCRTCKAETVTTAA